MKGPSLEAIRKFKEQQEQRKRQEYDKKLREKLSTLEHRAAQGDKKAKHQLKIIEQIDKDSNKSKDHHSQQSSTNASARPKKGSASDGVKTRTTTPKPKHREPDFEELMRLAATNNNEVRHEEVPVKEEKTILKTRSTSHGPDVLRDDHSSRLPRSQPGAVSKQPVPKQISRPTPPPKSLPQAKPRYSPGMRDLNQRKASQQTGEVIQARSRLPIRPQHRNPNYYDDFEDDDDDYECDGFVVDEDDDGVQDELDKTLRTVFRYDKRRCELREQALDREYRAIGRVSTFEDLEREERRASRLAAAEDARALREEEEHKRMKRQRLKNQRY